MEFGKELKELTEKHRHIEFVSAVQSRVPSCEFIIFEEDKYGRTD